MYEPSSYYRDDGNLHPHSPHSLQASPHISTNKSHFDPYPSHLQPQSYHPSSPSTSHTARYPDAVPSTYISDHSSHPHSSHSHAHIEPAAIHSSASPVPHPTTPPRIQTPVSYAHSTHGTPVMHPRTPELGGVHSSPIRTPVRGGAGPSHYGAPSTLKVVQWTPQSGDEGTQVTIVLDSLAVRGAPSTQHSNAVFGPGSPALGSRRQQQQQPSPYPVTRRFVVVFGVATAPTKFTRANAIDGNGVGQSMTSGDNAADAFVVLTTFVPARQSMAREGERVMVSVRVVDEMGTIVEECIVGEWEAQGMMMHHHPVTPPRLNHLKRSGDELLSDRDSPSLRSPARSRAGSPMIGHGTPNTWLGSPQIGSSHVVSPRISHRSATPNPSDGIEKPSANALRHPPLDASLSSSTAQPELLRTSQIPSGPQPSPYGGGAGVSTFSNKAVLKLGGDLNQMAMGWSNEEWTNRRRLIQFWRHQEGNVITATFRPISQAEFVQSSIVISCIFRDEWNECFVTSVDTIYLLEALVGVRFTVEEKNRIRRNLEGFKPMTVSKSKAESEPFFKLIMGFPNPKPRNIEKDVKVFPWKVLANALKKIIGKYSATYSAPIDGAPSVHIGGPDDEATHPPADISSADPFHAAVSRHQSPTASPRRAPTASPIIPPPQSQHQGLMSPAFSHSQPPTQAQHTRPGSFDFQSILDTSNFGEGAAGEGGASSGSPTREASSSSDRATSAFHQGPPDAYTSSSAGQASTLFPSAEDYGVVGDRLVPPPLNHSRSYSEGPRRSQPPHHGFVSVSAGNSPFAGSSEFYAPPPQQHPHSTGPPTEEWNIGQYGSKIGAARNRGIDVLVNEVSNRATPSLVAFGPKARAIGESAKTQETSNFRNTVGSLKRLIGRTLEDPDVEIEKKFLSAELVKTGASVGVKVNYLGEPTEFSATQLYAMYLSKLKDTAQVELKTPVKDIVIAVPVWYTEAQRRAVMDAADIAGLNPLRLINDTTATALGYGITKTELPPVGEPSKNIVFVDIGHSDYSVSIVSFNKGQLEVKATAYDRHFGGRDLDYALTQHFAAEFKTKYKIDVFSNKKALFRLTAAVEKLKKILSANALAPLSVESIMEDIDAASTLKREEFEELIAPLLERTIAPLERALADAGLAKEDIEAVELVGGTTRVPALKTRIQEFFGRPLSFTCNQDEAIARGATLACAILSPVFKVREFTTTDVQLFPIKFVWDASDDVDAEEGTELVAFDKGNNIPSTKNLSFTRTKAFEVEARYADPANLPGGVNPWIGKYTVKMPESTGGKQLVKVKAKLTQSGVLSFEGATLHVDAPEEAEPEPIEVDAPAAPVEGEAAAADAAAAAPVVAAPVKKAKKTIKTNLPTIAGGSALDGSVVNDFKEKEGQMAASDKLVLETEDRKNALEEYVYDVREKLEGAWKKYVSAADADALRSKASESEDWLYTEEGEDATKSAYVERLTALKALGDPILLRYREHEERPRASAALREVIQKYQSEAAGGDEKFSHIPQADLDKVVEACANAEAWLGNKLYSQGEKPLDVKPVITSAEIRKKAEEVQNIAIPIMTRPKPKPKTTEAPKEEAKPAAEEPSSTPAPEAEMADVEEIKDDAPAKDGQEPMTVEELD
ncbi:hypothetical protein MNV49_007507 [Pseudohyphozyma bogoriensis]|nr:hypothetical protein MNV49_007507 [Pseudohyphozyma bogoriensis]